MIAVLYRTVGGFMSTGGTFTARVRWSLWLALFLSFGALAHGHGAIACAIVFAGTALGTFLGRMIPHGFAFATRGWKLVGYMGSITFARVVLAFTTLAYFMPETLMLMPLGLLSGLCYLIGERFLKGKDSGFYFFDAAPTMKHSELAGVWQMESRSEPQVMAKGETEWGECLTGLVCYELPFWLTFLI